MDCVQITLLSINLRPGNSNTRHRSVNIRIFRRFLVLFYVGGLNLGGAVRFSAPIQTDPRAQPAFCAVDTESLSRR
jgi:hypothetical protein